MSMVTFMTIECIGRWAWWEIKKLRKENKGKI